MKVFFVATLVLLSASFGNTDFIKHCLTEEEFNKPLANNIATKTELLNMIRAKTAKKHQIANMHEWKYDMTLEKEARKMKSCDDFKHGVNYQVDYYGRKEKDPIWKEFVKNSANKTATSYSETDHPLLTSFIECQLTTTCFMETLLVDDVANFSAADITLYGWRGTLSLSDFQHGPPGSKCTHGTTGLELCISPPRSDSETIAPLSENNGEGVNSIFIYFSIAFVSFFL
ncbi:hypothetical protein GCK72_008604 [Caenorhabditis remanei]|uniref:SCP domain-containing protein n=1 Tax=Caenorhabditis remanei TaxID=31234 RepID=A0A6A5H0G4_CAERE|nr:hypothetical protein GCK72_008604 [Caenorhabditis remanei]KAF1760355.1 hypothetical protein GCK72_008604 [Caenorhabditis remanei]